jgi:hypothetical protein
MPLNQAELDRLVREGDKRALSAMETSDILDAYNRLTGRDTTKFASRDKGIDQTLSVIHEMRKERRVEAKAAEQENRAFRIKLPFNGQVRAPKANSKRAGLLDRMLDGKGITLEEAMSDFGWERKDAYEGIRHIHISCGYGIDQYPDGRVYAHTEPPGVHGKN